MVGATRKIDTPSPAGEISSANEQSWSTLGIMLAANSAIDQVATLRQWDHTGDSSRKISGNPESDIQSLEFLLGFLKANESSLHESGINFGEQIVFIESSISGYRFRQDNSLPGVMTQVNFIRQELYRGDINSASNAIQTLSQQFDAAEEVAQIKKEYQLIMDLHEKELIPDAKLLLHNIYEEINQGLSFASINECKHRLDALRMYAGNLSSLRSLAQMQGQEFVLETADELIGGLEAKITQRVLEELEFRREQFDDRPRWETSAPQIDDSLSAQDKVKKAVANLVAQTGSTITPLDFEGMNPQEILAKLDLQFNEIQLSLAKAVVARDKAVSSYKNKAKKAIFHLESDEVTQLSATVTQLQAERNSIKKLMLVAPYIIEANMYAKSF